MNGEPPSSVADVMASIRRMVGEPPAPADDEAPAAAPAPTPAVAGDITVDAFLRSMLEPMLRAWLDAHLPEIVEAATHAEIKRLTKTL